MEQDLERAYREARTEEFSGGQYWICQSILALRDEIGLMTQSAALRVENDRLRGAVERAIDWMTEHGCDCGTDDPGTCALCICRVTLARAQEHLSATATHGGRDRE